MQTQTSDPASQDIPERIFEVFLANLETAGVEEAVRTRLRKTLIEDKRFSEAAIRAAVFANET